MMSRHENDNQILSRRAVLKGIGLAPLLLRAAPFQGSSSLFGAPQPFADQGAPFSFSDVRLRPHYPAQSPLAAVLGMVAPGRSEERRVGKECRSRWAAR